MITFKTLGKKWQCPTSWDDLTYSQYLFHIYPRTIAETIAQFSGISRETIEVSELKGLEKINIALLFMNIPGNFTRTAVVNNIVLPADCTIESTGQFEDLRALVNKLPRKEQKEYEYADWELFCDLCLEACAIYLQKVKDGKYDSSKVPAVKEELKNASCAEIIGTGSFFLSKPLNLSHSSMSRFRILIHHLKRLVRALPGYQKTLDFLQRSLISRGEH